MEEGREREKEELIQERERKRKRGVYNEIISRAMNSGDSQSTYKFPAMHDMKIVASRRNITGITGRQKNIEFSAVSFPFRIHNPFIIGTR